MMVHVCYPCQGKQNDMRTIRVAYIQYIEVQSMGDSQNGTRSNSYYLLISRVKTKARSDVWAILFSSVQVMRIERLI